MTTWAIKDWSEHFTCSQAKKATNPRWVPVPIKTDNERFRRLMSNAKGRDAFAIFVGLVEIAARMPLAGTLADARGPLSIESLEFRLGAPATAIQAAIDLLSSKSFGWLLAVDQRSTSIPRPVDSHSTPAPLPIQSESTPSILISSSSDSGSPPERAGARDGDLIPCRLCWPEVSDHYAAYPKHRRGGIGAAKRLFERAVDDMRGHGIADPLPHLLEQIRAYSASWHATQEGGKCCWGLKNFIEDGVFLQDPSDWDKPSATNGTTSVADVEAILARSKR